MTQLDINTFTQKFNQYAEEHDIRWEMEGFVDTQGNVYPIDTDTKVLSTVFERLASPIIRTIAEEFGYTVETANQTTYPDFTLTVGDGTTIHRVAVDVKTTYREFSGRNRQLMMTLGSYKSFIRNNTKNILYPYDTYAEHWILGFVYNRLGDLSSETAYTLNNLPRPGSISCPYTDVSTFVREKVAITGIRAGSGNTANIGSIKVRSADDFSSETGPFLQFRDSKGACDHYWKNYERLKEEISTPSELLNHPELQVFR